MQSIRQATCHTLIIDESNDISSTKMLILYTADDCRLLTETLFARIILFVRCDSHSILEEIKKFANSALKYSCSLKKIFAQCKIFLEGTLFPTAPCWELFEGAIKFHG